MISPLLFNIYMAEVEEFREIGGVKVDRLRIWNLAYADDIVLLAKNRVTLLNMMDTFKRFLFGLGRVHRH